jgi:UDP-N-acetylmuramate dehydrogenase
MPLPALSNVALAHSLTGLEFGVAIPATLGGAVWMNAGAHHRSMGEVLESIDLVLLPSGERRTMPAHSAGLQYRSSALPGGGVVVAAVVSLASGDRGEIRRLMDEARAWRRSTQPLAEPNCGSVFKNPEGDHAARLVEAAGAKGLEMGQAKVSEKHANFIVAAPGATSKDVRRLIDEVTRRVADRFGVELETEVQFVGDFGDQRP